MKSLLLVFTIVPALLLLPSCNPSRTETPTLTTPAPTPLPTQTPTQSPRGPEDELSRVEAEPTRGFHWPYFLYIPSSVWTAARGNQKAYLLVEPNNTGYPSDEQSIHEDAALKLVKRRSGFARGLKVALLVPVFPRPQKSVEVYTHALDRGAILTKIPELERIDLQLMSMIKDARQRLSSGGVNIQEKVLMMGFSVSGMFVNRFTLLHPQMVQAAAIGSPGGWPIAPVEELNGVKLGYPIGISDIKELINDQFTIEAFKSVPLYFYLGEEDTNDCVPPLDYMRENQRLVFVNLGDVPIKRWPIAKEIYNSVGCKTRFVSYPGVGHTMTDQMLKDIEAFFIDKLEPH